jgi:hypothetical protein
VGIRFRPTLWPGSVIPLPPLDPMPEVEVKEDWIVWSYPGHARPTYLPQDFYMRELMNVKPGDLEAAAELMRKYGMLFYLRVDLPEEDREALATVPETPPQHIGLEGIHAHDIRRHIERAQSAIKTWLALQVDGGLEELVETETTDTMFRQWAEINSKGLPRSYELDRDTFLLFRCDDYIAELESTLNAALSQLSVGIVVGAKTATFDDRLTIYSASFLQLYNHMVEGASVRHCANEPCGRSFVRQRGRARFEQHRTEGIKYCSRECARAQAQRELRRRRRSEKAQ